MSPAELRIAWYSISGTSVYELAARYPDQFRQLCDSHSADVLEWNGVPLGNAVSSASPGMRPVVAGGKQNVSLKPSEMRRRASSESVRRGAEYIKR